MDSNDLNLWKRIMILLATNKTVINDDIYDNGKYTNIAQTIINIYNYYHIY